MSARDEGAELAAAVAELGALPMPVGPAPRVEEPADELTRLLAPSQALREDEGDRVVAYRGPVSDSLYCVSCGDPGTSTPLGSEDLPDGGLCAGCDVDVLIEQPGAGA